MEKLLSYKKAIKQESESKGQSQSNKQKEEREESGTESDEEQENMKEIKSQPEKVLGRNEDENSEHEQSSEESSPTLSAEEGGLRGTPKRSRRGLLSVPEPWSSFQSYIEERATNDECDTNSEDGVFVTPPSSVEDFRSTSPTSERDFCCTPSSDVDIDSISFSHDGSLSDDSDLHVLPDICAICFDDRDQPPLTSQQGLDIDEESDGNSSYYTISSCASSYGDADDKDIEDFCLAESCGSHSDDNNVQDDVK